MSTWINQNLAALNTALALAVLLLVYLGNKFRIDFALMNLWYSVPVIGKIARLSRDVTRYAKDNSWTLSERTLCDAYKQFIHFTTEEEFNKRLAYLAKANDLGRSPIPGWMMGLLCVLVLAEGLGFSYMLGTWMAGETGSENARQLLMWAIVFVLCVIFVFVMHSAGHQLYRSNLVAKANAEWRADDQRGKFASHNIKLNDPQNKDDAEPEYKQCVNRVGTSRSYFMVGVAAVIIVFVSVVSTVMRVKHLEAERTAQTALSTQAPDAGNPFDKLGQALPSEITDNQQKADEKAKADGHAAYTDEGLAAFLMLAFIFAITQLVGIAGGYKWGFAGRESKAAYRGTRGFSTYDDYLAFFTPLMQVAQSRLQTLQQKMSERDANEGLRLKHTFEDYLTEARDSRLRMASARAEPRRDSADASDAATIVARIDAMTSAGRRADAIDLLQSLPEDLRHKITAVLSERKAAMEAARVAEEQARKDEEERNKEAERARLDALL